MTRLLAAEGVRLDIREVDYDEWHQGEIASDIWLNSANFTLPLDFSLFSHLYEVPLIQHCIDRDWQQDAALWRAGEMNLAVWCQQLLAEQAKHIKQVVELRQLFPRRQPAGSDLLHDMAV